MEQTSVARIQAGRLCSVLPQGSPPLVPPMPGTVAAPSNGAGIRHEIHQSGGCGAPSFACGGCWGLCWLYVRGAPRGPLAGGHVRQGDGCHQRLWSKGWAPCRPLTHLHRSKPGMVQATSPPVPTAPSFLPSPLDPPSRSLGLAPQPRRAVLESPQWGPTQGSMTRALSLSGPCVLQGTSRVASGVNRNEAQLVPQPPSPQAELRALGRRRGGGGCLLWAVPHVLTALYGVTRRWCLVVAHSGVVLPPGAVFVGVAPTGVRAPLVVAKTCLGAGRGPKALARWESRQAARLVPVAWRGSSSREERTGATPSPCERTESQRS